MVSAPVENNTPGKLPFLRVTLVQARFDQDVLELSFGGQLNFAIGVVTHLHLGMTCPSVVTQMVTQGLGFWLLGSGLQLDCE